MKMYISGRIKDYESHLEHFGRAATRLKVLGHEPVNPCEIVLEDPNYAAYMRADIKLLLDCEAIYMLQGWEHSGGARCEHLVAAMCGLEIQYEPERLT